MSRQSKLIHSDEDTQNVMNTRDSENDMIELVVIYANDKEYVAEEIVEDTKKPSMSLSRKRSCQTVKMSIILMFSAKEQLVVFIKLIFSAI